MFGAIEPPRPYRDPDPDGVKHDADADDDDARHLADPGARPEFAETFERRWMNDDLADISEGLEREDIAVIVTDASSERAPETDVILRRQVILRQHILPWAGFGPVRSEQQRRVEIRFDPAAARAPDVEIAIAPRLEDEKDGDQPADEEQRRGRRIRIGVTHRQREAERHHRPVRRRVEARPPDRRAINLAAVKMRERADFRGVEIMLRTDRRRQPLSAARHLSAVAHALMLQIFKATEVQTGCGSQDRRRSEERRVGKECRSRWSP